MSRSVQGRFSEVSRSPASINTTEVHSKSTFSKYLFGREGGGHRKEYSMHVLNHVVYSSGRPLTSSTKVICMNRHMHTIIVARSHGAKTIKKNTNSTQN